MSEANNWNIDWLARLDAAIKENDSVTRAALVLEAMSRPGGKALVAATTFFLGKFDSLGAENKSLKKMLDSYDSVRSISVLKDELLRNAPPQMDDQLMRSATARVEVLQNAVWVRQGTAFLVARGIAATALHVVVYDRTEALPTPFTDIRLVFPGHITFATIHGDFYDRHGDWALLLCTDPPTCLPLPLARGPNRGTWVSYGFPDAKPDGIGMGGTVLTATGNVENTRALQLFSDEAAAADGMPVPGMSGASVVVGTVTIGILRWATLSTDSDGKRVSMAGTLYACPASLILDRCAEILPETPDQ